MGTIYRDYGSITDNYPSNAFSDNRHGQVYQATHGGDGKRLPLMNRSFISFTYGDKHIEDFNLIATISGDRLDRKGYAAFNDTVTTYDNLDGQHYWATHYTTNQLDFTLSTDGIDQRQLDDFLHWFKAGVSRELILAEHPNRAIMARVADPPVLELLPFESVLHETYLIHDCEIHTTLYKGDIKLSLVMDQPHWYAKVNVLGKRIIENGSERFVDLVDDIVLGQDVEIFQSKDALKILYEDGIPLGSMIDTSMLLGNGAYAKVDELPESKIWSKAEGAEDFWEGVGARIDGVIIGSSVSEITPSGDGFIYPNGTYKGIIAGALVDAGNNGISSLAPGTYAFFFYAGTAPAPTKITFTMVPTITNNYITSPFNSHSSTAHPYNTITVESVHKQELYFTTPNLYTSYNKAVEVFNTYIDGEHTWEQIRNELRNRARHAKVREWAMKCIEYYDTDSSVVIAPTSLKADICAKMEYFLKDTNDDCLPVTFIFNSETGEALGYFKYRTISSGVPANDSGWATYGTILSNPVEEDVGDMLRSNYIIIQDRNYPTSNNRIVGWTNSDSVENRIYTHRFKHDIPGVVSNVTGDTINVTNLQILYKNMYL